MAECSFQRTADAEPTAIILAQAEGNGQTGSTDEPCTPGQEGCLAETGEDKQENGSNGGDGNTQSEGGGDANETGGSGGGDGNTQSEGGGDASESSGGSDGGGNN